MRRLIFSTHTQSEICVPFQQMERCMIAVTIFFFVLFFKPKIEFHLISVRKEYQLYDHIMFDLKEHEKLTSQRAKFLI